MKEDLTIPNFIQHQFTPEFLLNNIIDKYVLYDEKLNMEEKIPEDIIKKYLPQETQNKSKIKSDSQRNQTDIFYKINNLNNEMSVGDIITEICELSSDLKLFQMEQRKREMMKLIEKMAENFENDDINPDNLVNMMIFGKEMIEDKI